MPTTVPRSAKKGGNAQLSIDLTQGQPIRSFRVAHDHTVFIPRTHIVALARSWKGTPYHHQQSQKKIGTDCLGLIRGVWRDLYRLEPETPPPYSRDWAEASGRETLLDAAHRNLMAIDPKTASDGDILVFRYRRGCPAKHVGILAESGHMIHAIEGIAVSEVSLSPWWTRRRVAAFSFPGVERVFPAHEP